jgi:hypothetical protein
LVDIHDDGTMAFRRIDQTGATSPLVVGPDTFAPAQYAATRRSALKAELLESLIADGLFQDEAEAMLATWEASYFHGVGLRLFFLAPHAWTDRVLPLAVSVPATITRVMVGRIDLLSTQQRAQLATIARSKTSTLTWWLDFLNSRVYAPTVAGKTVYRPGGRELLDRIVSETGTLAHLGVAIPPDYAAYLALGRFRQALMFHALEEHPAPAVKKFAMIYGLTSPFFPIQ